MLFVAVALDVIVAIADIVPVIAAVVVVIDVAVIARHLKLLKMLFVSESCSQCLQKEQQLTD